MTFISIAREKGYSRTVSYKEVTDWFIHNCQFFHGLSANWIVWEWLEAYSTQVRKKKEGKLFLRAEAMELQRKERKVRAEGQEYMTW